MPHGRTVFVRTPSRLHFGLLSFGHPELRQFGGVGAMIQRPGVELLVVPASEFCADGLMQKRIQDAAFKWSDASDNEHELLCRIELISAPRLHRGLGVGTQLALAVAAGLNAFHDRRNVSVENLARSVGRGLRSAVGTYGFAMGGLIAEQGKLPNEYISPLLQRVPIPESWRFVLISPKTSVGLHGPSETQAFEVLPPVPRATTEHLREIMCNRIVPAAQSADFSEFSKAVYEFGLSAGTCFESVQGSPYNGSALERTVALVRSLGVPGVGQSSWGPTIFAICESESSASSLVAQLQSHASSKELDFVITAPCNEGASVAIRD